MAAEGAVAAYEQIVGERWKPFERQIENAGATVDRKAADLQMAALATANAGRASAPPVHWALSL
ncbi:hypothetical protein C8J33_1028 [Rhizobium sp. PP-CC-3G-465]|nr:hypothetical protein C8J33_1028 [Rhizobium sp. PP-CC-3G-465]